MSLADRAAMPFEHGAEAPTLLVVCTGNAARSVMAGFMLEHLAAAEHRPLRVLTAGTHALPGQPMGMRTRDALVAIPELAGAPVGRHRSRPLVPADLAKADLVVAMEADHVRYVRRRHPAAAARTATIRVLCDELTPGPPPLAIRVAGLGLETAVLDDAGDVADPAGRDEDVYRACALELWDLCQRLVVLV